MRPTPLRSTLLSVLATTAGLVALAGPVEVAAETEMVVDGRSFTLPNGFVLERIAGPPLVDRPITADFDEQGRLYVADSSGSNDKVADQLAARPHRIVRLEDTDGDGRFDRRTIFADRMMFPEGTLWFDGSLYVAAPPSIWKLTDTDDDGVADRRVEWFDGKTLTGCANDLHGPYLGLDGWIYWCKGAFARQTYERPGKPPFVTRASHIFRARPDGRSIEPVMTGGMDNPVDVVFTPGGERIVSCTFLQHPANGRRDGLIHAVYGGVYGKVHDVLDGHVRTGPDVLPPLTHLGPAAPCGLTTYESDVFGSKYRDNLFACCFNLQKVTRHVLTPAGATFTSEDSDFLVSPDRDFHPTDVIEDADGSLVVVDTGGWYKLCCPTSQLPKPDVLGAIYRVRKAGAAKGDDPRGLALDWSDGDQVAKRLSDPRPAVRRRAIATMARLGRVPETEAAAGKLAAVWTACRIDSPEARAFVRQALSNPEPTVRQAACHAAGLWRDPQAVEGLTPLLRDPSHQVRRAAAEALGRIGDRSTVFALLNSSETLNDPILEHSITYALIEILDPASTGPGRDLALLRALFPRIDWSDPGATVPGLDASDLVTRRIAIVALDQVGSKRVRPFDLAPLWNSPDPSRREVAAWLIGRHPDWAVFLVGTFAARLKQGGFSDVDRESLVDEIARFAAMVPMQNIVTAILGDPSAARDLALRALAKGRPKTLTKPLITRIVEVLQGAPPALVAEAVHTLRDLKIGDPALTKALRAIGRDRNRPTMLRLDALAAIPEGLDTIDAEGFAFLLDALDPKQPVAARTTAAGVLAKAALSPAQRSALVGAVRSAGPIEIETLLGAFERTDDEAIGLALVDALKASPAFGALRIERLRPRLDRFGPEVKERAEALYAALNVDAASQKARLDALMQNLPAGDLERGQAVFNGTKAGCLSCHAVGYLGGKVGPDLTRIGQLRNERDLLESIVYPSLSFVRSYEPVTLALRDGRVVSGLLRKDSADEVVLAVNATDEPHFRRDEIDEIRPGTVSVMPAGLDQQLTRQELADLLAFLKSRK